jgi:hypothetical protein
MNARGEAPATLGENERPLVWSRGAGVLQWALVVLGVTLRVRQYLFDRSLWLDECLLALNIIRRSPSALLQPLDSHQLAPVGFLLLERLSVSLFGSGERALRLLPFLAGIASVFLFSAIARRIVGGLAGAVSLALFAVSGPLVYYASEAKQYSSDVAVALLLLALALPALEVGLSPLRTAVLAAAGAIAVWFSHPAIFVLAGIGLCLFLPWLRQRGPADRRRALSVASAWAASFAVNWAVALRPASAVPGLRRQWSGEFAPLPPMSLADARWFAGKFFEVFTNPVGFVSVSAGLGALGFSVACAIGFRGRRGWLAVLLAPLLFALIASALHEYPFEGRLLLFAVPFLLLVVGEGSERLAREVRRGAEAIGAIFIALLLFLPFARAAERFLRPQTNQELKAVLAHVRQHAANTDLLYGYRSSPAFDYYLPRFGFDPKRYVGGVGSKGDWSAYARDLERLRGSRRVWIVLWGLPEEKSGGTAAFFLYVLDGMGTRLDAVERPGAAAYLYDLSHSPRASHSHESLGPKEERVAGPRAGARGGTRTLKGFPTGS